MFLGSYRVQTYWLRVHCTRRQLETPYSGFSLVLEQNDRTMLIQCTNDSTQMTLMSEFKQS